MDAANKHLGGAGNDGVSESYLINPAADMEKLYDSAVYDCIERYLAFEKNQSGVNLLYRGVNWWNMEKLTNNYLQNCDMILV